MPFISAPAWRTLLALAATTFALLALGAPAFAAAATVSITAPPSAVSGAK